MTSTPSSDDTLRVPEPEAHHRGEVMVVRAPGQTAAEWQAKLFDARFRHDPTTAFGVGALQEALWQKRIELAASFLLRDAPSLDVGCGNGRVVCALAERGRNQFVGIDVSAECIRHANEHNARPNVTFEQASIESFAPSWRFGLVTMYEVLEHVDDPAAVLRRLARWLRPGGHLIFSTPNRSSLNRMLKSLPVMRDVYTRLANLPPDAVHPGHVEEYHYDELLRMVRDADLTAERTYGAHLLLPFPNAIPVLARSRRFARVNVGSGDWWPRRATDVYVVARKPV